MPTSASGGFSLFLQGDLPNQCHNSLPLVTVGSQGGGEFGGLPLYTAGENVASGHFPLYLAVANKALQSGSFPLFIDGSPYRVGNPLPIYIRNTGVGAGLPLYVRGSGITDGWVPFQGGVPLFLRRAPAEALPLFLLAPGYPLASGLPVFARGSQESGIGIPVYCSGGGHIQGQLPLYAHGF